MCLCCVIRCFAKLVLAGNVLSMPNEDLPKILVVEDEASIADTLQYALESERFLVVRVTTGSDALKAFGVEEYAMVILDIGLPDMSGFDVCRKMRESSQLPILFLTARESEVDVVLGLELGADDYMRKPFSPRELTARVRAHLRRSAGTAASVAASPVAGGQLLEHDKVRQRILCRGAVLELTRNEYQLLAVFIAAPGRVFSRDQLLDAAWADPLAAMDRTVDAHVKTLRAKLRALAPDVDPIVTHRGLGYSLDEAAI